mgnify:CR=1 FL=1
MTCLNVFDDAAAASAAIAPTSRPPRWYDVEVSNWLIVYMLYIFVKTIPAIQIDAHIYFLPSTLFDNQQQQNKTGWITTWNRRLNLSSNRYQNIYTYTSLGSILLYTK